MMPDVVRTRVIGVTSSRGSRRFRMQQRWLIGWALIAALAAGCGVAPPAPAPAATQGKAPTPAPSAGSERLASDATTATVASQPLRGVGLSPLSYSFPDFPDFLASVKEAGLTLRWGGDWAQLGDEKAAPHVVAQLAKAQGITPIIGVGVFDATTGQLNRPLDPATVKSYKDAAVAFAQKYQPPFLEVGAEVNILFERSPDDFDRFVDLFAQVHGAVKAVSPGTRVFTGFQLERLNGLRGGLFGGKNDVDKHHWSLLDRFPATDLVAFTTYPGLVYKDPLEVPSGYYRDIATHTGKPLAFTEIGWHTAAGPTGWESSPAEQAHFVRRFRQLTHGLPVELVVWLFLFDQTVPVPFDSMGLFGRDGKPRPAWTEWMQPN